MGGGLTLGAEIPNFEVDSTQGPMKFHDYLGNGWGICKRRSTQTNRRLSVCFVPSQCSPTLPTTPLSARLNLALLPSLLPRASLPSAIAR